jgi:hypothetical protein
MVSSDRKFLAKTGGGTRADPSQARIARRVQPRTLLIR